MIRQKRDGDGDGDSDSDSNCDSNDAADGTRTDEQPENRSGRPLHEKLWRRQRDQRCRADELFADWDGMINRNPTGWAWDYSVVSSHYLSFPEMDALVGWATHQVGSKAVPNTKPQGRQQKSSSTCRKWSTSLQQRHTVDREEGETMDEDKEDTGDFNDDGCSDDESTPHQHLLPSSSTSMAPPSVLWMLEQCARCTLDPALYRRIWSTRRGEKAENDDDDENNGDETEKGKVPPHSVIGQVAGDNNGTSVGGGADADAVVRVSTAQVALACVLEEAMVEALLPLARAYVNHCRQRESQAAAAKDAKTAASDAGTVVAMSTMAATVASVPILHGEVDNAELEDAARDKKATTNSTSIDAQGVGRPLDDEAPPSVDDQQFVDAWTASPDQALVTLLLDRGASYYTEDNDPASVQQRENVLACLRKWKNTERLIQSLSI
jgi:hypothetical protein